MRYINLPQTNLKLSAICMGTVLFGSETTKEDAFRTLDEFIELGGNFLDTALMYADWIVGAESSASEKTLGKWLKERHAWDKVTIATKGGERHVGGDRPRLSAQELDEQIEASRKNLGLDTLPLYYLHRDDTTRTVEEIMDPLFEHVIRGHITHLSCSNWTCERILAANEYAKQCGQAGFVAVSNGWSMARYTPGTAGDKTLVYMDDTLYAFHTKHNLTAIPFSSTAGGYFAKLDAGLPISPGQQRSYGTAENDALFSRARRLASDKGMSVAQLCLSYFYSHPFPVIPVTSFLNHGQMVEAARASEIILTPEEFAYLEGHTSPASAKSFI